MVCTCAYGCKSMALNDIMKDVIKKLVVAISHLPYV